jgi:hypothetical protein
MTRGVWRTCVLAIIGAGWAVSLAAQSVPASLVEVRVRGVTVDPKPARPSSSWRNSGGSG